MRSFAWSMPWLISSTMRNGHGVTACSARRNSMVETERSPPLCVPALSGSSRSWSGNLTRISMPQCRKSCSSKCRPTSPSQPSRDRMYRRNCAFIISTELDSFCFQSLRRASSLARSSDEPPSSCSSCARTSARSLRAFSYRSSALFSTMMALMRASMLAICTCSACAVLNSSCTGCSSALSGRSTGFAHQPDLATLPHLHLCGGTSFFGHCCTGATSRAVSNSFLMSRRKETLRAMASAASFFRRCSVSRDAS
mmetsp:Transcript_22164/g.77684  ORF Transcript_22164/g.77684 Transcript_22164/m.77684 type:complete len:254 (+) Transcript_22164:249-1010(+)